MKRKQIVVFAVIALVLAILVYLQVSAWRRFDWTRFREGIEDINWFQVFIGVVFIYIADFLRAVRWKIFLRPTRPKASFTGLISPQYVGFTGLALLGRPGELIRPYLIARRTRTTLSQQMAIWLVERVFDIGAVTVMLSVDLFLVPSMRQDYPEWRVAGYGLIGVFFVLVLIVWGVGRHGPKFVAWVCRRLTPISPTLAAKVEQKLTALSAGMNTVKDPVSFLELVAVSMVMWVLIGLAYRQVTHAYPPETGLPALDLPEVILLMAASVAGGVIQLPVIGGGSQFATIAVLSQTFGYQDNPELAVSCGILLWLVTFVSVAPLGLALAHREHVSIRELGKESEMEKEQENVTPTSPVAPKP